MTWRSLFILSIFLGPVIGADLTASAQTGESSVHYVPLDAPDGMSQAVVVQGGPLVYTRQLLPIDGDGMLVGEGVVDKQVEQVVDNLATVLEQAGAGLDQLVRVNVYALSAETVDLVRSALNRRLEPSVRPAITAVLTSLTHRQALVAVDAVAVGGEQSETVALEKCTNVTGYDGCADVAVLPRGGVAYLSGIPESGGLTESAVSRSMSALLRMLEQLQLSQSHIVHLKVFLTPASSAKDVLAELKHQFPDQLIPPVVFVEWIASVPVEIELVAQLPVAGDSLEPVEFYNPPEVIASPTFSRVVLVRTDQQIFTSSLWARSDDDYEARGRDVFDQLEAILAQTGSDMRHMVKATYYVSDDETSGVLNTLRPELFDPERPPAASKATVHGVGRVNRTLSIDMIAVGAPQ